MTGITKEEMRRKLGNITQLRELLFGEQIEEYERKFDRSFQDINQLKTALKQLENKVGEFRADVKQELYRLENNLSQEISSAVDSLEKKIQYLNLNTRSETKKLHQELQETVNSTEQNIDALADSLRFETTHLKNEIFQTKESLENNVKNLKEQFTEKIDKNLSELMTGKVSRADLAEVLFELCLKIKETNIISDNKSNGEENITTELLLSDEKVIH